jgi:HEAT repeat protein
MARLSLRFFHFVVLMLAAAVLASIPIYAQAQKDEAWAVLKGGLTSKDTGDRAVAVHLLGTLQGDALASDLALKALKDEKPEVRSAAADSLGQLKTKSAITVLTNIINNDHEPSVVIASARALVALDDPLGYGVFYAVLTGEKKSGGGLLEEQKKMLKDPKKVAQFGFEQGIGFIPFGGLGLNVIRTLTKDDVSPVRAAAAKILANDPDIKSLAALEKATDDDSWLVRAAAIDAIRLRRDPSVLPTLGVRLADEKPVVRYAAAAAIIHLYDIGKTKKRSRTNKSGAAGL